MARFFVVLLMTLTFAFPVSAKKKISILGFEAGEGLTKKAKMATKLFRKYASRDSKLTLMKHMEVEEVKIEYCDEEKDTQVDCLKKIANKIGAQILITGKLTQKGDQIKVSVSFLAGGTMKYTYKVFPAKATKKTYQVKIRELWYSYFKGMKSRVVLDSPEAGASVMVDDTFLFKTVPGSNEIPQITPGQHEIKVVSPTAGTFTKKITVKAGDTVTVKVSFPKSTVKTPDPKKNNTTAPIKTKEEPQKPSKPFISFKNGSGFWKGTFIGTAILSAALIGGSVYFGLQVSKFEDDKKGLLDPANPDHFGSDVCAGATGELKSVCDDGQSAAMNANVLMAAGVVVGIVSTYFLYKGFLATSPEVDGDADVAGDTGGLSIMPVFTPHGGGITVGTRF